MNTKQFINDQIYHICNKSIAGYGIFKDPRNAQRLFRLLNYYNNKNNHYCFSYFLKKKNSVDELDSFPYPKKEQVVKYLAYCIMPDHYHLLIKVQKEDIVSKYIADVENSYSRYFNIKFERKGPLWQSRFRSVLIKNNKQLIHTNRYIHLNPTTAGLVDKPEDWEYSSYKDYLKDENLLKTILTEISFSDIESYKKFVNNNKNYQKHLAVIKKFALD